MDPAFTRQVATRSGRWSNVGFAPKCATSTTSTGRRGVDGVQPPGGMFTPDVMILAPAFYDAWLPPRPLTPWATGLPMGPTAGGCGRGDRGKSRNAAAALRTDALVLVFPGGDYVLPATLARIPSTSTAAPAMSGPPSKPSADRANVSIRSCVPAVLACGNWLAALGLTKARMDILPLSFGFPFGLSMIFPPNLPLPAKIVTEVLEPIDITARFGADPDVDEVDAHVRSVMEDALKRLAGQRRFPFLG